MLSGIEFSNDANHRQPTMPSANAPAAANAERAARERETLRGSFRNDAGDSGPANAVRREQQGCMAVSGRIECPDRSEPIASPRACKDRREQKRMIVFASTHDARRTTHDARRTTHDARPTASAAAETASQCAFDSRLEVRMR
ncbi:hypothetical protein WM16_30030 [Burkholderia ubonensis]|uniref:Uncharacterized protein n=1 Tax=Burkholderia ubonensis TaxID=101571 RepID=A0A119V0X6_9BURK|nr:hypothetical protein WM16_30030 [Burkholderia ubonensis]